MREETVALASAGLDGRHFVCTRRRDLKGYREDNDIRRPLIVRLGESVRGLVRGGFEC
jgi:hypothetical protein